MVVRGLDWIYELSFAHSFDAGGFAEDMSFGFEVESREVVSW